jgi:hypothetical protein
MKRIKSIAGLAAGLMMAGSMLAPAALAQYGGDGTGNNTTTVAVTFNDPGAFDAYFCAPTDAQASGSSWAGLTSVTAPTLTTPGSASGALAICYTDTKLQRPSFDVSIQSSDFTGDNTGATIGAENFTIVTTYNVAQGLWGSSPDYGDVGSYINDGVDPSDIGGGQHATLPYTWLSGTNSLDEDRLIQFGYSGIGTQWSNGKFDVNLVLPLGIPGDTYKSTLEMKVLPSDQP